MPNPHDLQPLVRDAHRRLRERPVTIAVVGDIILDNAIEGVPGDPHPETGVPILTRANAQESVGGAGNIAMALARLGANVSLFGVVGADLPGRQTQNLLDRMPFANHLVTEPGWPTPRKDWIYERTGGQVALKQRIDYDRELGGGAREELVGEFRARCPATVDVVILADHGLGTLGPESLALIALAKERRARLVAIPRTTVLRGQPVDAIVINASEMRRLAGAAAQTDPRTLAERHAREYAQDVFLTLMEDGILVCPARNRGACTLMPGFALDTFQWMGARDMATTAVALSMAAGLEPLACGQLANACRHLVAGQRGNGRVLWRDVYEFVGLTMEG